MMSRLLPRQIDNAYRGHWLASWIFVLVILLRATQSVMSIINTRSVLTAADGIPIDSFSAASAAVVLSLFALLGLYGLVIPLQSVVVLIRYRAMIPFMYLSLLIVNLGSRALLLAHPVVRSVVRPIGFYMNLVILATTLIGFALSLLNKPVSPVRDRAS